MNIIIVKLHKYIFESFVLTSSSSCFNRAKRLLHVAISAAVLVSEQYKLMMRKSQSRRCPEIGAIYTIRTIKGEGNLSVCLRLFAGFLTVLTIDITV